MKFPQALIVCVCLLGATHLALSQVNGPAARTIPGYLDPATGKFTTRIAPDPNADQNPAATTAGTNVLFREDFQIKITNYDQVGTMAVCSVDMASQGDSSSHYYSEQASVSVTSSGGTFSCDVPVLTLWSLQTPTTDQISASVTVTIYTPGSSTGFYGTPVVYRSSSQSLTLTQPGNTQTVVTPVTFTL